MKYATHRYDHLPGLSTHTYIKCPEALTSLRGKVAKTGRASRAGARPQNTSYCLYLVLKPKYGAQTFWVTGDYGSMVRLSTSEE